MQWQLKDGVSMLISRQVDLLFILEQKKQKAAAAGRKADRQKYEYQ